jgi:hypothetical protein
LLNCLGATSVFALAQREQGTMAKKEIKAALVFVNLELERLRSGEVQN